MTSANRHMARIHRSHRATAQMLGTMSHRNHISRTSKQIRQGNFVMSMKAYLTSMKDRLSNLSARLSERFTGAFRKQDR